MRSSSGLSFESRHQFSEIFLQYTENTKIYDIWRNSKVKGYFRYVDDILIVYKENHKTIKEILGLFHSLSPGLNFTLELEEFNRINYLDLTIMREENKLTFDIFRKPTITDAIVPSDSCRPIEHKLAAIRFFTNKIQTYNLDFAKKKKQKQKETDTLKQIIHSNKYSGTVLKSINNKRQKQKLKQDDQNPKLAKFTYIGRETTFITKPFRLPSSRQRIPPTVP